MKRPVVKVVSTLLYPFIIYFGLKVLEPHILATVAFAALLGAKMIGPSEFKKWDWKLTLVGTIAVLSWLTHSEEWVRLYPVFISVMLGVVFLQSLFSPPNVIEKIALKMDGQLSPKAVLYTRKVCQVWVAFFIVNGAVALATVYLYPQYWLLYNGFVSYTIMVAIFALEFIVRSWVQGEDVN